ncbi:hypothetical protein Q6272_28650, partial [Klebsiella pneumoniae]|uniref:hypothetical protein n=1 Tax=Klebsiella pneumoniae TaxID=573 RepID=UPI00272FA2D3
MIRAAALSVLTLALLVAAAPVARAQAPKAAKPAKTVSPLDRCLATPEGQSTYGMIDCIGKEVGVQDARLNR